LEKQIDDLEKRMDSASNIDEKIDLQVELGEAKNKLEKTLEEESSIVEKMEEMLGDIKGAKGDYKGSEALLLAKMDRIKEIHEELKETEKWNIKYSTNPKNLITMTKVLIADECSLNMSEKIKQSYEWPLFIYVVSEMEVITE
jgi:chromosome segregation ATPase